MTAPDPIIRLAAKGDGVTATGRHIADAVPGDVVDTEGLVTTGAHHQTPPCRHFAVCGGCQLQHADDTVLADFVRDRVVHAARGQGLEPVELLPVHLSPPHTRRRAGLHGLRTARGAVLGYREGGSHRVVDLAECPVLHPALAALIGPLRKFVAGYGPKGMVGIDLTLADQGVEANLTNFPLDGLGPTEAALDFARDQGLARLTVDQGYGPETQWEPEPVTVTLAGVPVSLPPGAFLQATHDAEERMAADAAEWLTGAKVVADLFAGLGTFAFALRATGEGGRKVLAVEAERATHLACKSAGARIGGLGGGQVLALHRDLFRSPLEPAELNRFEAVLLDPPRAGARAQVAEISASTLPRVVYVSCNPSSWARDAAVLAEAGFRLTKLRPVGQFRWSTHVELVSLFER